MTGISTDNDPFIDQIMRAIVKQFFENPPITSIDGPHVQHRSTPVQVVAGLLLEQKQGELIDKIMERIDLDTLADTVADKVVASLALPAPTNGWRTHDPNEARRKALKDRVDARLVELLAAEMLAEMQAEKEPTT